MRRERLRVDYAGVLTTDLLDSLQAFCELEGLYPQAIGRRFREDRDCRELLIGLETGPDPVILGAVRGARAAGVRTGIDTVHHRDSDDTVAEVERLLGVPLR